MEYAGNDLKDASFDGWDVNSNLYLFTPRKTIPVVKFPRIFAYQPSFNEGSVERDMTDNVWDFLLSTRQRGMNIFYANR